MKIHKLAALFTAIFLSLAPKAVFASAQSPLCGNPIETDFIIPAVNFLAAGVGVVVVIMVIVGAVQYTASAGNPQAVEKAKKRITNALLALVTFALMYAFLQFIIPGGTITLSCS